MKEKDVLMALKDQITTVKARLTVWLTEENFMRSNYMHYVSLSDPGNSPFAHQEATTVLLVLSIPATTMMPVE